jgi:hypothetical protein
MGCERAVGVIRQASKTADPDLNEPLSPIQGMCLYS